MSLAGLLVAILSVQLIAASAATKVATVDDQQKQSNTQAEANTTPPDAKPLGEEQVNTVIRGAIFGDHRQLLSYLSDRTWRQALCTPALKETYEIFQSALQEEIEVLWDLIDNAATYGLSKKEHEDVKACSVAMEKYLDNFKAWEQLNAAQAQ